VVTDVSGASCLPEFRKAIIVTPNHSEVKGINLVYLLQPVTFLFYVAVIFGSRFIKTLVKKIW
jgi:hypothetical protein